MNKRHSKKKLIALIPARKGSERVKNKNIQIINGHPLMAYTIVAALNSKIFDKIIVSTDSIKYSKIAKHYGAEVPFLRPKKISTSKSTDFLWICYTIEKLKKKFFNFEKFCVLRPTSPFRSSKTILSAWKIFKKNHNADSIRSVELCSQHPGKMWHINKNILNPIFSIKNNKKQPLYNQQYKTLPKIYIQNGSLEISKVSNLYKHHNVSGKKIISYISKNHEGFDINKKYDLEYAKYLIKKKKVKLEKISKKNLIK